MSGFQGRVYVVIPSAEPVDQPIKQGTFFLSRLWARVLFDYGASHSFIATSVLIEWGLEVDMSWLRVRDLGDSTHSGLEGHGHVRV